MDSHSELGRGLTGLLGGGRPLERTLTLIAQFAVDAIPGAEGAGLTLIETDRPQTVVATADFVREVDRIQYDVVHEGPCLSAVAERRTFTSGNLGGEAQWPRFGPRVGRLGVHSALSLPLLLPDRVLGALNVYAHSRDVFGPEAVRLGEVFAPAAVASVANAQLLAQADRVITQLQDALRSRAQIDHAIGILMSRSGVDAEQAFERLRTMSQSRSIKLVEAAREIVDDAVRRARARHASPPGGAEGTAG
jgi:transcriptional regulator with GAF, ATPase, and Fis domain